MSRIQTEHIPAPVSGLSNGESHMNFFNRNIKRKRISSLIKATVKPGVLSDESIRSYIKRFSKDLPTFFFDTVGDANIAGLVLATMLENQTLKVHQINSNGFAFIKFMAEMDFDLFEEKTPRVVRYLRSIQVLDAHPGPAELESV